MKINSIESLGKAMSSQDVASILGVSLTTVYSVAEEFGGIRVGDNLVFFENIFLDRLKKKFLGKQKSQTPVLPELDSKNTNTVNEIQGLELGEWANLYLDFCKKRLSSSRYRAKCLAFRQFFKSFSRLSPVDSLQKQHVLQHFSRMIEAGRTPSAANDDLKNLRSGWNWARNMATGFPQKENPFCIPLFPADQKPRYVPSLDDFFAVYAQAETEQDEVMLLAFLCLAARRKELFCLRVDHVDLARRQVALGTRKRAGGGLQYDWVPMADQLLPRMQEQIERVPGPWVFPCPKTGNPYTVRPTWMPRLCDRAGVRRFGLHAIRHLTASLLAASNVPTVQIQRVLRHQRISTTDIYIRSLGSGIEAVAAIPLAPKREKDKNSTS